MGQQQNLGEQNFFRTAIATRFFSTATEFLYKSAGFLHNNRRNQQVFFITARATVVSSNLQHQQLLLLFASLHCNSNCCYHCHSSCGNRSTGHCRPLLFDDCSSTNLQQRKRRKRDGDASNERGLGLGFWIGERMRVRILNWRVEIYFTTNCSYTMFLIPCCESSRINLL